MSAFDVDVEREARGADLLLFRIGGERFATPLAAVEEAVDLAPDAVQTIPGGAAALRGVFTLRGALIPLYAADRALGVTTAAGETALVVHGRMASRVAIAVDDVEDVIAVRDDEIRDSGRAGEADAVMRGVVQRGTTIIAIVDLDALVAACRATEAGEPT